MTKRVALLGSSGFVGAAVKAALGADHEAIAIPAPRLRSGARDVVTLLDEAERCPEVVRLADQFSGVDAVVNAAGLPDASSMDDESLLGANALLPAVTAMAARRAGVSRFVHVSSAVVQNDKAALDESEVMLPFSPYSTSKVLGELLLRQLPPSDTQVVRYRPPSVHAPTRRVTRMVSRIASSPMATVASPGNRPTPQALLPNVAAAIAFLAVTNQSPPPVVIHPSEGLTTSELLSLLGDREPRRIPLTFARSGVRLLKWLGTVHRPTAANARRVELLWLGQGQAESWLTCVGWKHPVGREGWQQLRDGTEITR